MLFGLFSLNSSSLSLLTKKSTPMKLSMRIELYRADATEKDEDKSIVDISSLVSISISSGRTSFDELLK